MAGHVFGSVELGVGTKVNVSLSDTPREPRIRHRHRSLTPTMSRSLSLRKHVPGLLQRMQQQPSNAVRYDMQY